MKKLRTILTVQALCIVVILLLPVLVQAQPDNPPSDPDVPIDGGLCLLVVGGVGYGIKKIRESKANTYRPKSVNA